MPADAQLTTGSMWWPKAQADSGVRESGAAAVSSTALSVSVPSPDQQDDAAWRAAVDDLIALTLSLQPPVAWAGVNVVNDLGTGGYGLAPLPPERSDYVGMNHILADPRWGIPDAYPVQVMPVAMAQRCQLPLQSSSVNGLVRVDVNDPRLLRRDPYGVIDPAFAAAVDRGRRMLAPILASSHREPPPTEDEIGQGLGRLSWFHRRYGPPSPRDLPRWVVKRGEHLDGSPRDLEIVDAAIDDWRRDPELAVRLIPEVALQLGSVLFTQVADSRWDIRADGAPIIRLRSGKIVDLASVAEERVRRNHPRLPSVLVKAGNDSRSWPQSRDR